MHVQWSVDLDLFIHLLIGPETGADCVITIALILTLTLHVLISTSTSHAFLDRIYDYISAANRSTMDVKRK